MAPGGKKPLGITENTEFSAESHKISEEILKICKLVEFAKMHSLFLGFFLFFVFRPFAISTAPARCKRASPDALFGDFSLSRGPLSPQTVLNSLVFLYEAQPLEAQRPQELSGGLWGPPN